MGGHKREVLHKTNLVWPNGLTIDVATQTLYWMDGSLDRLESSKTDGSNRKLLSTQDLYQPFCVTFYQGTLFWSDWQINAVQSTALSDPTNVDVLVQNLDNRPMGVKVVCSDTGKQQVRSSAR